MGHRKRKRSKDTEQEESGTGTTSSGAHQRPNGCDICMMALVGFFVVLVIAISIPLLLVAYKATDIAYISDRLLKKE